MGGWRRLPVAERKATAGLLCALALTLLGYPSGHAAKFGLPAGMVVVIRYLTDIAERLTVTQTTD